MEPITHNVLIANGTDLAPIAMIAVAVVGFLFTLWNSRRQTIENHMTLMMRQRDEARRDLDICESRVRALERALELTDKEHDAT